METTIISVGDKEYKVQLAETKEEREQGLSDVKSMPEDEGMLFVMPGGTTDVTFNTTEMLFPIDMIFIDNHDIVYDKVEAEDHGDSLIIAQPKEGDFTKYVLEINRNSGIEIGDEFEMEDDVDDEEVTKMYIIGPDGKEQMELFGGERIVSRISTRKLIHLAKKAKKSKEEKDYKKLGKYMFKVLKQQDTQKPQYVDAPNGK